MREIKFRAWHKIEKKMYELQGIDLTNDKGNYGYITVWDGYGKFYDNIAKADAELMQYTGLKDKNGKEIYEGDIVKADKGGICVVRWEEQIDRDRFWATAYGFSIYFEDGGDAYEPLEVIGNIYENPGLLQQAEN